MIRILDVCSGTGSIERWVDSARLNDVVHVTSVDIAIVLGRTPTHLVDVTQWDYEQAYPPGHFDVVWASPPCTQYSMARTTGPPRDFVGADRIVQRCLDIIRYFKPRVWIIENPAWGYLRNREVMTSQNLPNEVASYCQYGMEYRKDTRFWSNLFSDDETARNGLPKLVVKRCNPATCHAVTEGKQHRYHLSASTGRNLPHRTKWLAGRVPEALIEDMLRPVVGVSVHSFL